MQNTDFNGNYCYERARETRERALRAENLIDRELSLNVAAQWLALGAAHDYAEILRTLINQLSGNQHWRCNGG